MKRLLYAATLVRNYCSYTQNMRSLELQVQKLN